MLDEQTYEEWDKAVFLAREGDPRQLGAFLRKHRRLWPESDIDPGELADLFEGKLRRPRGKPSAAAKRARRANIVLRAADGDRAPLVALLETLGMDQVGEVPDFRFVAQVVRGDYRRSPGPYPGSRIAQGLDARPIVERVREVQKELRQAEVDDSLPAAWEIVGEEIHKSWQWVRDEYYKMAAYHQEPIGPADAQSLKGAQLVGEEHLKLENDGNGSEKSKSRKRRKSR